MTIFSKVKKLMDDEGIKNVLLTGGGIIPKEDMQSLAKLGVGKMFGPGTTVDATIDYIEGWVNDNRN
jgi:methylmalonyl-CoA mutase C-terminal domain/subunit